MDRQSRQAYSRKDAREKARKRRELMAIQRLMGVVFLVISAGIIAMTASATSFADKDGTALLFTVPLGFLMLFSKKVIIQ